MQIVDCWRSRPNELHAASISARGSSKAASNSCPFETPRSMSPSPWTMLCLVHDRRAAVHEAARVFRPGGRLVMGDLGRHSLWAAKRRVPGWFGSTVRRAAHFTTATELAGWS
jgi:hypothetical protein